MKKHISTILIVLVFMVGLLIMLYPTISNWYNQRVNSYVVTNYMSEVANRTEEEYEALFEEARAYNDTLPDDFSDYTSTEELQELYNNTLDVAGGAIGYIEIEKIGLNLAIYHGTDSGTLQQYVGHLEGSPFPTGDVGNNTVLTGHTGLPSAELFTDLTEMEIGDTFKITVLNEVYTYEVYDIVVIEPTDLELLGSIEGKDVVTLVTCTPYGVNSHRLLVMGERIENEETETNVITIADTKIKIYNPHGIIWWVLGFESLFFLLIGRWTYKYRRKEKLTLDEKINNKFQRLKREESYAEVTEQKIREKKKKARDKRKEKRKSK